MNVCAARGTVFTCSSPCLPGEQVCFWHSSRPKTKKDVEDAVSRGEPLAGANLTGLDLSEIDLQGLKLVETDFSNAILEDGNLRHSDLWRANLTCARLARADLSQAMLMDTIFDNADLEGAILDGAFLRFTSFRRSVLKDVSLKGSRLQAASFVNAVWEPDKKNLFEQKGDYDTAIEIYLNIKQALLEAGDRGTASEFRYREMDCRRKKSKPSLLLLQWLLMGYGERPLQVAMVGLTAVIMLGFVYWAGRALPDANLLTSLYFSASSFAALGYGSWVPTPEPWARALGVLETVLGVVLVSTFLVTATRRWG